MTRKPEQTGSGFILSLELILIMTILMIGTFAGCALIRDALFKFKLQNRLVVVDNDGSLIGRKIFDFDQFETPRVLINDPQREWLRILLGVRYDRFTTRQQIFYTDNGCGLDNTASACILSPGDRSLEESTITSFGPAGTNGFHSEIYPLQLLADGNSVSYAIGADLDVLGNSSPLFPLRLPGTLYRSGVIDNACDEVCSVWTSQKEVLGEPCDVIPDCLEICNATVFCERTGVALCAGGVAGDDCGIGEPCEPENQQQGAFKCSGNNCPVTNNNPVLLDTTCDGFIDDEVACIVDPNVNPSCVCPIADGFFNFSGANCCPIGTDPGSPAGQCSQLSLNLIGRGAEVVQFLDNSTNLLSIFDLFFRIPTPHSSSFFKIPPTREGDALPSAAAIANGSVGVPLLDNRIIFVDQPPVPESDGLPPIVP